ncbi:conserved hypothetical protein [uncultured Defluviicoccus sp.]|uniref:UspA domain-containing protein n=1 Tax=metagenome TaxID=256318 RepID=A0A380T9K9_9ZZZZ|nr:conserved hypothetical protein [uncultured Defluviicoccus sp.]
MRDVFLQIDTYAEPTPLAAIDQAVRFAKLLDCSLTGLAVHIDIHVPDNWLAERLLHVQKLAAVEEAKSLEAAQTLLKYMTATATTEGVRCEETIVRANVHRVGDAIANLARTRDLALVPLGNRLDAQRLVAEDVLFGSGRPMLAFHPEGAPLPSGKLGRVAIAWDRSRCAARAVSDALPLLKQAGDVRIVTVVGEKASAKSGLAIDLVRHLKCFGIVTEIDEVDGRGRSIGASLDAYVDKYAPQLMVMGGYGTSKLKEFVLGGATEHVLNRLRVATLLSH